MTSEASPVGPVRAWRALLEVHADMLCDLSRELEAGHGLSVSDFDVLVNIGPHEEVRHKDLCGRVVLTRSALTRMVDRLVRRGLVTRERDLTDHRGVRIRLTDTGRRLRQQAAHTNGALIRARLAGLDADDLETLSGLLQKMHTAATTQED